MSVMLHFHGGPIDGLSQQVRSQDHPPDRPIVRRATRGGQRFDRGYYTSIAPWVGIETDVDLEWFYGTPELRK
jgi:hypothetical protein